MAMRIGIFGGTFDPPHRAHVAAAVAVAEACALDRLLLMVAADPWQKRGTVIASAADRYAMVEAAVDGLPHIEASDLELRRGGPTYSVDTIEELRAADRELFLVVGADVVPKLPTWHRVEDLQKLCTLVIINRAATTVEAPAGWRSETVAVPEYEDSSTEVRARLAAGRPLEDLVPPAVVRLIRARGLYTSPR